MTIGDSTTGTGQYIDVAMAATLMSVNERAHVDLNDDDERLHVDVGWICLADRNAWTH